MEVLGDRRRRRPGELSRQTRTDWLGFAPLLLTLSLAMLAVGPLADAGYGGVAATLAFPALFAAAALALRHAGPAAWIGVGVWAAASLLWTAIGVGPGATAIARLGDALFVGAVGVVILRGVMRSRHVTLDTILGGIAVYLLIGVFFSAIYSALELALPGSFLDGGHSLRPADVSLRGQGFFPALPYYSLVTMTTLGYGDVAPIGALPRSLAAAQAVIGQLYIAVLIAFLVGVHIAERQRED